MGDGIRNDSGLGFVRLPAFRSTRIMTRIQNFVLNSIIRSEFVVSPVYVYHPIVRGPKEHARFSRRGCSQSSGKWLHRHDFLLSLSLDPPTLGTSRGEASTQCMQLQALSDPRGGPSQAGLSDPREKNATHGAVLPPNSLWVQAQDERRPCVLNRGGCGLGNSRA